MAATEQFGPIGIGWGYISGDPIIVDTLMVMPVTLWHGDRANTFGPMMGCEEWKDKNGRVDSDAPKKATTDAITKLLSQLGFNADVFLGKFDDNKYVQQMEREFAAKDNPPPALITDAQRDELTDMMNGYGVSVQDFCKVGGIQSLKELHADNFAKAKAWIMNQRKAA